MSIFATDTVEQSAGNESLATMVSSRAVQLLVIRTIVHRVLITDSKVFHEHAEEELAVQKEEPELPDFNSLLAQL